MSKPALYERVALARDLDEYGLKCGDVATVVDEVPHPAAGPDGIVLEVTNALGDSLQVVIVEPADVEPLSANEVPTKYWPSGTSSEPHDQLAFEATFNLVFAL